MLSIPHLELHVWLLVWSNCIKESMMVEGNSPFGFSIVSRPFLILVSWSWDHLRQCHAKKTACTETPRKDHWRAERIQMAGWQAQKKDSMPVFPTSGRHMYSPAVYTRHADTEVVHCPLIAVHRIELPVRLPCVFHACSYLLIAPLHCTDRLTVELARITQFYYATITT